jgi:hypothetical protein
MDEENGNIMGEHARPDEVLEAKNNQRGLYESLDSTRNLDLKSPQIEREEKVNIFGLLLSAAIMALIAYLLCTKGCA